MCEEGDDEVGAEHGDCAGEEEGAVPLLLPQDVRQDGQRHGQADGERRHQAVQVGNLEFGFESTQAELETFLLTN